MTFPTVNVDLSSILVTAVGFLLALFIQRTFKSNDKNFDIVNGNIGAAIKDNKKESQNIHSRIDKMKAEIQSEIKDARLDIGKTHEKLESYRDKASDSITAVRISLEDKMEIYDERIRKLEQK